MACAPQSQIHGADHKGVFANSMSVNRYLCTYLFTAHIINEIIVAAAASFYFAMTEIRRWGNWAYKLSFDIEIVVNGQLSAMIETW